MSHGFTFMEIVFLNSSVFKDSDFNTLYPIVLDMKQYNNYTTSQAIEELAKAVNTFKCFTVTKEETERIIEIMKVDD